MTDFRPPVPSRPGSWLFWSSGGSLRASDQDREEVVAALTEHHVQGRLSSEELGQRSRLAYAAHTNGQLNDLLRDLPGQPSGAALAWAGMRSLRSRGPFPNRGYVAFWPRVGALLVDLIVVNFAGHLLQMVTAGYQAEATAVLWLFYFPVLWSTIGRTPGLALIGARVVRQEDGGRLGFRRGLVRLVGYLVDACSLGLGFAWAGVDPRKQAWHDKMAGSYVVRKLS
ncbi:MAG: RDD family protein [Candidatus Dormibacteria bacterium]